MALSYIFFNIVNVILQTIKSIVTIRCNKYCAAAVNAVAYGIYTYILVLTSSDLNLWFKILTVAGANLVGVFVVKLFEEKAEKTKLWKVEAVFPDEKLGVIDALARSKHLSYSKIKLIGTASRTTVYFFCYSRKDTDNALEIIKKFDKKYFVTESKI